MASLDSLESLRKEINNLDEKILELIAQRLKTAEEIGAVKIELGLPVIDEEVSSKVIERNRQKCAELGLEAQLGKELTELLMRYSIKVQKGQSEK